MDGMHKHQINLYTDLRNGDERSAFVPATALETLSVEDDFVIDKTTQWNYDLFEQCLNGEGSRGNEAFGEGEEPSEREATLGLHLAFATKALQERDKRCAQLRAL